MPRVVDWMTKDPSVVEPSDSLEQARQIMEGREVAQLPVVLGGKLVGMVTDAVVREGSGRVADVMAEPIAIHPAAPATVAATIMRCEGLGGLPVAADGRLLGIITRTDILRAVESSVVELQRPARRWFAFPPLGDSTILT